MTPYGHSAMVQELGALRAASQGERNNTLNRSAYTLAQLIGKGHIDETDLVNELLSAAQAIGLDEREALQTIRSGIRHGRAMERGPDPDQSWRPTIPRLRPLVAPRADRPIFEPSPTGFAPPDPWQKRARALIDYAQGCLFRGCAYTQWLISRGIDEITAKAFGLGWLPGEDGKDLFRPRSAWGLPPVQREDGSHRPLWIPRGLVIPWRGIDGIHRIRIRRPEGEPRYYVIPGSEMDCFIMPRSHLHRAYVVVESELDAIMLDGHVGDLCGVVALGSSSHKPDRHAWMALSQAARVLISLDNDSAGEKAARWYADQLPQARIYPAPAGKDPGEAYQMGVDIREWIMAGLPRGWFLPARMAPAAKD